MKYTELLELTSKQINEIMPWDVEDYLQQNPNALIVDVRETHEFEKLRMPNSISAPRGILENASLWDYNETIPELASAQQRAILVVCRSGYRSCFAALTLQLLGFEQATSLKLGLKGLNDEDYPLLGQADDRIDGDVADEWLTPPVRADQRAPA